MRESVRNRSKANRKILFLFVCLLLVLFVLFKIVPTFFTFGSVAVNTVFNSDISLKKTDERVNVLLLGIGGGKHDGPNLTDTIIFVSLDPKAKKVSLVSIPRDLWVEEIRTKINAAYANGEEKSSGGGLKLAKAIVGKVIGQPVDYGIRIDFDGFVKAIDMLGGLEVDVENTLDDYAYPVTGKEDDPCDKTEEEIIDLTSQIATNSATESEAFPCRYEHLHFDPGKQHMDGETALKFVRSRHALGSEGSDFARSKRQEKVIQAVKEKVFSVGTFLNPVKLVQLFDVLQGSIDTDIKQNEYDDFIKLAKKMEDSQIDSFSLDIGDSQKGREGLLMLPSQGLSEFGGQWVIIPRAGNGDYSEIQRLLNCKIRQIDCVTPTPIKEN